MDILSTALSYVLLYKYAALFVVGFIGAFIAPIPSSTTLAAASAFASQGYLNFYGVIGAALLGNIAGDNFGYFLARRYGKSALTRIGFGRIFRSRNYHFLKDYITTYPGSLIYFSRFLTEADPAINVLAGVAGVPYKTYLTYELFGECSYVLLYGLTGYMLGSQ